MRGAKPSLILATMLVVGLAAWSGAFYETSAGQMATAGSRLISSLDKAQIAKATFPFDSPERINWHFIPRERKGLPIKEMTGAQRALAFGLLQSGLGASGYLKATTIMSLEQILKEIEQGKGPVRDPELYFFTVFGKPTNRGKWGWRVEGHHLSLNFTVEDGKVVSATPTFFGANPAEVRVGTREGLRALGDVEDRALRLVQALSESQRKSAVVEPAAPKDIRAANTPQPPTDPAIGLSLGEMTDEQKAMLKALVEEYVMDVPTEVGQSWTAQIRDAGPELVKFAWFGETDRTKPHAFRVQGPTFLIEFNNTQNEANHIHSVWRSMKGDFGVPVSAQ